MHIANLHYYETLLQVHQGLCLKSHTFRRLRQLYGQVEFCVH